MFGNKKKAKELAETKRQLADAQRKLVKTRAFAAANVGRLTASWTTSSQSYDWDIQKSLNVLRARSRDICTNNDYGSKFLQMCTTNVVGPNGFRLQVRVKEQQGGEMVLDKTASAAIEAAFWNWAKKGNCDVTGKHSFFDICNLYIKACARDGEVLIKKVYGKQAGLFGYQLQILDVDRLDVDKNDRKLQNGNIIKMGVEINPYGKPVNYHLRISHPGDNPYYSFAGQLYETIPASEIFHHFVNDRPEQNRGIPWLTAAMMRLQNLGAYEEAAIINARVGASKMGFFETADGDGTAMSDGLIGEDGEKIGGSDEGELMTEADPGVFGVLPEGVKFNPFNPDYPHAMYDAFVKTTLRGVASGLGVAYNTIGNDLEGVNFSSIRSGVIEERDNWTAIQKWMIENFLDELFPEWLKFSLLSKAIVTEDGAALPITKYDKFNKAKWHGRRWSWVDPKKDMEANTMAIDNRLRSREDVISEMGGDKDDIWAQLSEEEKELDSLGIRPNAAQAPQAEPKKEEKPTEAE